MPRREGQGVTSRVCWRPIRWETCWKDIDSKKAPEIWIVTDSQAPPETHQVCHMGIFGRADGGFFGWESQRPKLNFQGAPPKSADGLMDSSAPKRANMVGHDPHLSLPLGKKGLGVLTNPLVPVSMTLQLLHSDLSHSMTERNIRLDNKGSQPTRTYWGSQSS